MHLPQILERMLHIIRVGNCPAVTRHMLSDFSAQLAPNTSSELAFRINFENGWYVGMEEFMGTYFGNIFYGDGVSYSTRIDDQITARQIFDAALEMLTCPA